MENDTSYYVVTVDEVETQTASGTTISGNSTMTFEHSTLGFWGWIYILGHTNNVVVK